MKWKRCFSGKWKSIRKWWQWYCYKYNTIANIVYHDGQRIISSNDAYSEWELMVIAVRWVYWLNLNIISLLVEIKQNLFQLVDHQFSDDWMPFEWYLFDKWKSIVNQSDLHRFHCSIKRLKRKEIQKEVEMNWFVCFLFSSNCLIFIDFGTTWKEWKEDEKQNECLMRRRTS